MIVQKKQIQTTGALKATVQFNHQPLLWPLLLFNIHFSHKQRIWSSSNDAEMQEVENNQGNAIIIKIWNSSANKYSKSIVLGKFGLCPHARVQEKMTIRKRTSDVSKFLTSVKKMRTRNYALLSRSKYNQRGTGKLYPPRKTCTWTILYISTIKPRKRRKRGIQVYVYCYYGYTTKKALVSNKRFNSQ